MGNRSAGITRHRLNELEILSQLKGWNVFLDNELQGVKDENGVIQDAGDLLTGIDILTENNV